MLIPTRYQGIGIDTATGAYVPIAPVVETRADAVAFEVRRADVDHRLVEETERTIRMASRTLGLDPPPRLRWLPAATKGLRGVVFDEALSEIWVKIQAPEATENTALHELRHVWQLRADRYKSAGLLTMEQRQADADRFAESWDWRQTPAVVDQAAAHREWERVWRPVHEATAREYAERFDTRRSPMLRAGPALGRQYSAHGPIRRERKINGVTEIECEQCGEWVRLNVTHRCPAARRQTSAAGYDVKVIY